ncbi:MAG: hypothetical protein ABT940_14825, partial [Alphaproteobacteria bacterium]
LLTGAGALVAILPAVAFMVYDWATNQDDLNDGLKTTAEKIDLNVSALQTLISTGSEYADSAQRAIDREKERKTYLLMQAEAALAAAEANTILKSSLAEQQLQARAAAGDALAAIVAQTSMSVSTELNAQRQDALINKIAELRAELRKLGAVFEDEAKKKPRIFSPEELIPAGDALDLAEQTIRTQAPQKLQLPETVGSGISRQISGGFMSAFEQGAYVQVDLFGGRL